MRAERRVKPGVDPGRSDAHRRSAEGRDIELLSEYPKVRPLTEPQDDSSC
jgi:hypothetical protein